MSALPPKADIDRNERHVCSVQGLSSLILERNATNVASPELPASHLSGFFVEPSEACTIEDLVTLLNAFSERMARRKRIARFKSCCAQMLPCLVLAVEGANLDQPCILRARRRMRRGDMGFHRRTYRFDLG